MDVIRDIREMIDNFQNLKFVSESKTADIKSFIEGKEFVNPKSTRFFYHGTKIHPKDFNLKDDYNWEDSNEWGGDLPEGYLFLTTDIQEASAYGQYIIPCEFKRFDNISFTVNANNPSQIFDRDYGIDLFKNDRYFGFWEKFENSMKAVLIIKGYDKSTLITDISNIIPRVDLAISFYSS